MSQFGGNFSGRCWRPGVTFTQETERLLKEQARAKKAKKAKTKKKAAKKVARKPRTK